MKLFCPSCQAAAEIIAKPAGPGLKALCGRCGRYVKFLNKDERLVATGGARPLREDVLARAQRLAPENQQWLKDKLAEFVPASPPGCTQEGNAIRQTLQKHPAAIVENVTAPLVTPIRAHHRGFFLTASPARS